MKDHSPSTRPMRGRLAGLRRGLILLAIAASTSCGRSDRIAVHPVEGSVRFGGEPAVGALVVFHPLDASEDFQRLRPAGTVDADGNINSVAFSHAAAISTWVMMNVKNPDFEIYFKSLMQGISFFVKRMMAVLVFFLDTL